MITNEEAKAIHDKNTELVIAALRAENARLREALTNCAEWMEVNLQGMEDTLQNKPERGTFVRENMTLSRARAALRGEQ